jgi:hypothetical protein
MAGPNAQTVASIEEARTRLQFAPREPQGLGQPIRLQTTDVSIAFVYDTTEFGRVIVFMALSGISEADWLRGNREHVLTNGAPGTRGIVEEVTIRGGIPAFIGTGADGTPRWTISWREGPVEIRVNGPTLSREQVLALAERV